MLTKINKERVKSQESDIDRCVDIYQGLSSKERHKAMTLISKNIKDKSKYNFSHFEIKHEFTSNDKINNYVNIYIFWLSSKERIAVIEKINKLLNISTKKRKRED